MEDFSMEEFEGLDSTGFESKQPIAPEDEFFHSIYIAGQTRNNHINVTEQAGKIQLRGVEYNLDSVYMIITHVKQVLAKVISKQGRDSVECFSFQSGPLPWKGTSGKVCGSNSAERASDEFCNACRAQLIVTGIYCEESGKPIVGQDKKPIFLFIRAKGVRYSNVSEYLNEMAQKDLSPLFKPVTPESTRFEKAVVNNKRFVTKVTITEVPTNFGNRKVFKLEEGNQVQDETVKQILKISKKTLSNFNEKFDWSKNRRDITGYAETQVSDSQKFDSPQGQEKVEEKPKEDIGETFVSFDDIDFDGEF